MPKLSESLTALSLLSVLLIADFGFCSDSLAAPSTDQTSSVKIEFNISEPLGLLRFVNGISKQSDEGQSYYDFFILHHKLNKEDKELLRRYQRLQKSDAEFEIPSGRKLSLHQRLTAAACSTKSFEDFFKEASQFCKNDEFDTLQVVMNHFRPVYEQLIWKPLSPQLNKDLAWFRTNEQAYTRLLATVALLFQSSAGREQPLKASLVPVPTEVKKEGNGFHFISSAFSENLDLAVVQSVEIVPADTIAGFNDPRVNNNRSLEDNDGLIHELVHMLWAFRSPEFKKALLAAFEKSGRQFNYDLLNESQAAAIQAWFYRQVRGKDKSGRWYDNSYVDRYAKALLPILQEYVSADGSATVINADDYAQKAMKAFDTTFPKWQEDPQIMLWRSQIVQAPISSENLAADLNEKLFDFGGGDHRISLVKGETWPMKFAQYLKHPELTTVFLLHPNQIDLLHKYFGLGEQQVKELNEAVKDNKDSDKAVVKALHKGQQCLVFSIATRQPAQVQGLLDFARPTSDQQQ